MKCCPQGSGQLYLEAVEPLSGAADCFCLVLERVRHFCRKTQNEHLILDQNSKLCILFCLCLLICIFHAMADLPKCFHLKEN